MLRSFLCLALAAAAAAQTAEDPLPACASAGIAALQKWYAPEKGLWKTTNWWNAANATTVLVRYSQLTPSSELRGAVENTYIKNGGGNFLNKYYDDEGWWALAWIDAYAWSYDGRYLAMAENIFDDMAQGWDDTCSGGIWWNKDKRYKNAIANELFLSVAARLAGVAPVAQRAGYLDWAKREWSWFAASGMINSAGLVNDGLTAACKNNGRNTWSYNQGVVLGGLASLASLTHDDALLNDARDIARAALSKLTDADGILHDTCEPNCGADGVQFKGIFARNLADLYAAAPDPRFAAFLQTNARNICRNQSAEHTFGVVWSKASSPADAATQVSALDAIIGAVRVVSR